jgi:NAD(P)-dependent dehydrogenase (short-subunit alcohol dehydrogenase family)
MREQPDLSGRTLLITGAGGGVGTGTAVAAARAGAEVILCGKNMKKLERCYDAVSAAGGPEPALFPLHLSKAGADDYRKLVEGIQTDCGKLDGIVHAAARFEGLRPLSEFSLEEWQRTLHVNLTAAFVITQACLPLLRDSGDASVVFLSDQVGRRPAAFWGGYAAAKAGLEALVHMLMAENSRPESLRFYSVDPGPLQTDLRQRAFPNDDPDARPVEALAPFLVSLLAPGGYDGEATRFGPEDIYPAA